MKPIQEFDLPSPSQSGTGAISTAVSVTPRHG